MNGVVGQSEPLCGEVNDGKPRCFRSRNGRIIAYSGDECDENAELNASPKFVTMIDGLDKAHFLGREAARMEENTFIQSNHIATMSDLHRAGRNDRMSDDVLTLPYRSC